MRQPSTAERGFTLLEAMVVVAIVGILASLAVPDMVGMAQTYRAIESSRGVLLAATAARALAQRNNAPVEMAVFPDRIELRTANTASSPAAIRKLVDSFTAVRTVALGQGAVAERLDFLNGTGGVTSTAVAGDAAAVLRFCASSDSYFRMNDALQTPVCGVGDLANTSAKLVFKCSGIDFHIRINAPMATAKLVRGL